MGENVRRFVVLCNQRSWGGGVRQAVWGLNVFDSSLPCSIGFAKFVRPGALPDVHGDRPHGLGDWLRLGPASFGSWGRVLATGGSQTSSRHLGSMGHRAVGDIPKAVLS